MASSPFRTPIVADGSHRIRSSPAFRQKEQEIRARIAQESAEEMARAPWWRKPGLKWAMERKIRQELDKLASPYALYIRRVI